MKIKNIKALSTGLLIIMGILCTQARAGIIDYGTYTEVNGMDWLDMSYTDGKSYNDVLALTASGQALDGWIVASFIEVQAMYNEFGFTNTLNSTQGGRWTGNTGWASVNALLGQTYGNTNYGYLVGYVSDVGNGYNSQPTYQQVVQTGYEYNTQYSYWRGDSWGFSQTDANNDIGTYLRRNTSEVPEPSTLAIFALGMIGLASRRFKKQS